MKKTTAIAILSMSAATLFAAGNVKFFTNIPLDEKIIVLNFASSENKFPEISKIKINCDNQADYNEFERLMHSAKEGKLDKAAVARFLVKMEKPLAKFRAAAASGTIVPTPVQTFGAELPYLHPWRMMTRAMLLKAEIGDEDPYKILAESIAVQKKMLRGAACAINYLDADSLLLKTTETVRRLADAGKLTPAQKKELTRIMPGRAEYLDGLRQALKGEYACINSFLAEPEKYSSPCDMSPAKMKKIDKKAAMKYVREYYRAALADFADAIPCASHRFPDSFNAETRDFLKACLLDASQLSRRFAIIQNRILADKKTK